jgi:integrase/recombinase XerD
LGQREARDLSIQDIDIANGTVRIRNRCITRSRKIPMSDDLCEVFRKYFAWRLKKKVEVSKLFVNKDGKPARYELFLRCFRKQCEFCNIRRERSSTYQPRLHDLKFTFAVHRITSWIRSNTDLNRMLPALAAYMGLKLVSTERYFYLTPERFTKQLNKLSPLGRKDHWRNDPDLMAFLTSL